MRYRLRHTPALTYPCYGVGSKPIVVLEPTTPPITTTIATTTPLITTTPGLPQ